MRKAETLLSVMLRFLAHLLATLGHWAAASTTYSEKTKLSLCDRHIKTRKKSYPARSEHATEMLMTCEKAGKAT